MFIKTKSHKKTIEIHQIQAAPKKILWRYPRQYKKEVNTITLPFDTFNHTLTTIPVINKKKFNDKKNKNIYENLLKNFQINSLERKAMIECIESEYKAKNVFKVYVKTTLHNIFITYTKDNKKYNTKTLSSLGFKGKSKQAFYAYKAFVITTAFALNKLNKSDQPVQVNLYIKFFNFKTKSLIKLYKEHNIRINEIFDVTPIPFNGCRGKKIAIKKKKKSIIKFLTYK